MCATKSARNLLKSCETFYLEMVQVIFHVVRKTIELAIALLKESSVEH